MSQLFLEPKYLDIVKTLLKKHLFNRGVLAFGSRVSGKHKPHSDLDLCILGESPLDIQEITALKEDFSESDLPIRIDLVEWASISADFKKIIEKSSYPILSK